jgi:arylsulfatase A-like enzyme
MPVKPNLVFVFADQWRAQAAGYAGDPNAITPNLDGLAAQCVRFTHAVSGCPVCSPYRASLLTGQYWLTHGVFMNDVCLRSESVTIAEAFGEAGYDTGYIGKWHLDGHGRSNFIPRERRQGFQFWKALECTHDYNNSYYYGDTNTRLKWDGYDAVAQTREAQEFIRNRAGGKPFALFLSWGPPHAPYETAPDQYKRLYDPERIRLRPNVPVDQAEKARRELAGYYAHISALDSCVGEILRTLRDTGIDQETVFVFTSDHGDLLHSLGREKKQQPFDESIRVPFLLHYPAKLGARGRAVGAVLNTPDIMPTLLGLCGVKIPGPVEGEDYSRKLLHGKDPKCDAALLLCVAPFGQWPRSRGGREYRGIRTRRCTYVRDLEGPWLLYDNETDPYQLENLCNRREHADLQRHLDEVLMGMLTDTHDEFLPGGEYLAQWGYEVDETGTVPYTP